MLAHSSIDATYEAASRTTRADGREAFIRLESLLKSYREGDRTRVVLDGASAWFARGEFTAIVGQSGSGKSTLLNLISGIDQPDGGAIWLDGLNLTALPERQRTLFRRGNIGFIFQFFNLIPTLTVWENVVLPLELAGGLSDAGQERARALLDSVGLLPVRDIPGAALRRRATARGHGAGACSRPHAGAGR